MSRKAKHYVVWVGRRPGIYDTWPECEKQVKGFTGARYMAFEDRQDAEAAFRTQPEDYIGKRARLDGEILRQLGDCYVVDAACSGYPGPVEYRCVHLPDGREVFRQGPYADGSVNVGEFLAIVHALALFAKQGIASPVYSDSETAIGWVKAGKCNTQLARTDHNAPLFDLIARAEEWLRFNQYPNVLLKWDTEAWGESPADFGRK